MAKSSAALKQVKEHPSLHALDGVKKELASQLRGKEQTIELSLACFLAGGHLLLEGPPGSGKTSLARGLSAALGGTFRRVQMTSDLLPSDIVGFLRLKTGTSEFEFRRGPIFSNFLLADELNRSNAKTQSALLEAMAEGTVTVDGVSHVLPNPFFVVATQNPMEFQGVYPLAESQLDRFMLLLPFDFPDQKQELEVYATASSKGDSQRQETPFISLDEINHIRSEVSAIHIDQTVLEYCVELVRATRRLADVSCGVSVRGGLQLTAAARALAYLRGRTFVTPQDIQELAVPALAHRLCYGDGSRDFEQRRHAIRTLLDRVKSPR